MGDPSSPIDQINFQNLKTMRIYGSQLNISTFKSLFLFFLLMQVATYCGHF